MSYIFIKFVFNSPRKLRCFSQHLTLILWSVKTINHNRWSFLVCLPSTLFTVIGRSSGWHLNCMFCNLSISFLFVHKRLACMVKYPSLATFLLLSLPISFPRKIKTVPSTLFIMGTTFNFIIIINYKIHRRVEPSRNCSVIVNSTILSMAA